MPTASQARSPLTDSGGRQCGATATQSRVQPLAIACAGGGTHRAKAGGVRFVLLAVVLSGCLAGSIDAGMRPSVGMRPAVMPKLSELPGDAGQRDGILNQSGERAGPEQRRSLTRRERKVETMAAVAAALIGEAFSTTKNVTFGFAADVDEDRLFTPAQQQPKAAPKHDAADDVRPSGPLVPWIRLDQKSKPADIDSVR